MHGTIFKRYPSNLSSEMNSYVVFFIFTYEFIHYLSPRVLHKVLKRRASSPNRGRKVSARLLSCQTLLQVFLSFRQRGATPWFGVMDLGAQAESTFCT